MIRFTLNCIPTSQARARHGVVHGHSMTFKADKQRANEQTLDALLVPHAPATPMTGAVVLEFERQRENVDFLAEVAAGM